MQLLKECWKLQHTTLGLSFFWEKRLLGHTTHSHPSEVDGEGCLFSAGLVMSSEHSVGFTGTRYHGSSLLRSLWLSLPVTSLGAMTGILRLHEMKGLLLPFQPQRWALHPKEPHTAGLEGALTGVISASWGRPSHVSRIEKACYFGCIEVSPSPRGQVMFLFLLYILLACYVNLGVVRPNTGLLLRVCWPLACLLQFTSPQHSLNPVSFRVPETHCFQGKTLIFTEDATMCQAEDRNF